MSPLLAIPNNDTHALFDSLVQGRPFSQQTLLDLEPTLAQYGIKLTPPNAAGERTKIGDPIGRHWTRVGFGEGHWVWMVQGDAYVPPTEPPVVTQPPPPPPSPDLSAVLAQLAALTAKVDQLAADEAAFRAEIRAAVAAYLGGHR
jgi:hypothetical protein